MRAERHNRVLYDKTILIISALIIILPFVIADDKGDDWPCGIGSLPPCNGTGNTSFVIIDEDATPTQGVDDLTVNVDDNEVNDTNFQFSGVHNVSLKDADQPMVEFPHNFSNGLINFSGMKIKRQKELYGYTIIKGLNITQTKSIFVPIVSGINSVCAKDEEIESIAEISPDCNGSNETLFRPCEGQWIDGKRCTIVDHAYRIENLSHSGAKEQPPQTEIGYFTVNYLQEAPNHRDGYLQEGDMVMFCFEGSEPIFDDQMIRLALMPENGYPTIAEFRTPGVMVMERIYLYP